MSWYAKVVWAEGLFLRPQHLQQSDRYVEHLLDTRTRHVTPYPWGFSTLEIDADLALQNKFALRRAAGIMPDGLPFSMPDDTPLPAPVEVPPNSANQQVWLRLPVMTPQSMEVEVGTDGGYSRYVAQAADVIDATAPVRSTEEIDLAQPRFTFDLWDAVRPGFAALGLARILEVRDKSVIFDDRFVPPVLVTAAHPTVDGWIDRVIGWMEAKLDELSRYAADPGAGGGLQSADYLILQLLNRQLPGLKHLRRSRYVHPERLYERLLAIAGELATFATPVRRAAEYRAYDHDDLDGTFTPLLRDIQDFLSTQAVRRAIRLELVERSANAYVSPIRDRTLFRNASFVLEVAAGRPLTEIQSRFPNLLKIGPSNKMNEIVHAHLPGVGLIHIPTPPPAIRAVVDHVYFALDRSSPLWPDFSQASSMGFHFSGDWPELELELWAVPRDRA